MSATILSFKSGEVLSLSEAWNLKPRDHVNQRVREEISRPNDRIGHWRHMVNSIEARYGDQMPRQGCVYGQSLRTAKFDSYGFGNVHNSVHQWRGRKFWNKPMPMPCDLEAVEKYLKKMAGKVLRLGYKSDPFMWMDHKYSITKSILEIANENDVSLVIHTMSDLCAHDEYATLLKQGDHTIVMQMGFEDERYRTEGIERLASPGGPSLKRRELALKKLKDMGVDTRVEYNSDSKLALKLTGGAE